MSNLALSPLYEINTAVYLNRLSQKFNKTVTLASIPDSELEQLTNIGCRSVWLMGVWQRSPAAKSIARKNTDLTAEIYAALPDFKPENLIGSAYSVKNYLVDKQFGDQSGLASLRKRLNKLGIKLFLDFVPNHVALDHPWVKDYPDYFIRGNDRDLTNHPDSFVRTDFGIFACGRDPSYPPWTDVLQLNSFSHEYRRAAIETLKGLCEICDGVRCDMAMLMLNGVFKESWGKRAGSPPFKDFWQEIIKPVKQKAPGFVFIAETYWNTHEELINQGFDYCYDKDLYDCLCEGTAFAVSSHIAKTASYRQHLLSFIENHDEARSAAIFDPPKLRAAFAVSLFLPGLSLIYDGQLEGYRIRVPVQLNRGPKERINKEISLIYQELLKLRASLNLNETEFEPLKATNKGVLAWRLINDSISYLVLINYSGSACPIGKLSGADGQELKIGGKELNLYPWQVVILKQT